MALDIGTNTEVSLVNKGKITATSCASGPAFEGGHIKYGMRAATGAIERLRIAGDSIQYQTIDEHRRLVFAGRAYLMPCPSFIWLESLMKAAGYGKTTLVFVPTKGNASLCWLVRRNEAGSQPSLSPSTM